jgi:hypothetical protein
MQSVSCVHPVQIQGVGHPEPQPGDMLSTLARTQKHAGQFICEIDTLAAAQWDPMAREFGGMGEALAPSHEVSHLLVRRHGKPVAWARIVIGRSWRGGQAVIGAGLFWHRRDENPEQTIYRAALGAIVQEYCIRRGHRLRFHADAEYCAEEIEVLRAFGFVATMNGAYVFRMPPSSRIIGHVIDALRVVQRVILPSRADSCPVS